MWRNCRNTMTAFQWIEGVGGEVVADGKRLEAVAYGPPPDQARTLVMLHEGLGCLALWRDFPAKLAAATGHGVFAYSRAGYGGAGPFDPSPPLGYNGRGGQFRLPAGVVSAAAEGAVPFGAERRGLELGGF